MFTVIGYERKKGDYEGKPYDNYKFYFLEHESEELDECVGQRVLIESGKYEDWKDKLPVIGSVVEIYYNKYQKVSMFVSV